MSKVRKRYEKGIRLLEDDLTLEDLSQKGEIAVDSNDSKLKYRDDSATREVADTDSAQTLENKTIDATAASGNNTISMDADDVVYDNAASGLTATDVKAALDELKTGLDNQNEASEIEYDNTDSGLTATDVQAAIDEVEDRVDTAETDISNNTTAINDHINDTVDAHDASAISVTPAGNLAADDVQGALEELQNDVDTRALASDLTDHIDDTTDAHDASAISYDNTSSGLAAVNAQAAVDEVEGRLDTAETDITNIEDNHVAASSGVHGVTGNVVGDSDTQTLQNKTLDSTNTFSGAVDNPIKLEAKQDTLANLETYAASADNGEIVYATDIDKMFRVLDGALAAIGGGGGTLLAEGF